MSALRKLRSFASDCRGLKSTWGGRSCLGTMDLSVLAVQFHSRNRAAGARMAPDQRPVAAQVASKIAGESLKMIKPMTAAGLALAAFAPAAYGQDKIAQ